MAININITGPTDRAAGKAMADAFKKYGAGAGMGVSGLAGAASQAALAARVYAATFDEVGIKPRSWRAMLFDGPFHGAELQLSEKDIQRLHLIEMLEPPEPPLLSFRVPDFRVPEIRHEYRRERVYSEYRVCLYVHDR